MLGKSRTRTSASVVEDSDRPRTATEAEVTSLRSVVGSLADLKEANRVVELAQADQDRSWNYPARSLDWHDVRVVTLRCFVRSGIRFQKPAG